jgi:hypothetical protein
MPDVNEVVVGKPAQGGGVLAAPIGTTLPTGATAATSALDADFEALGFITDDGLTKSEDRSPSDIVAWGGDTIATTQETFGLTWQFTVASILNEQAALVLHGDANVTTTAADATERHPDGGRPEVRSRAAARVGVRHHLRHRADPVRRPHRSGHRGR